MCAAVFSCGQSITFGTFSPRFCAVRHRLDRRRVVGAEVAEQVLDAELVQAFDEVIGGGVLGRVADLAGGLLHGDMGSVAVGWDGRFSGYCALSGRDSSSGRTYALSAGGDSSRGLRRGS